ncbi:hypothetical protein J4429_00070 [Candidatus Pacearchaeota archaeon]|nr:hypothetical protein [Candidatus Pacearchaeota archaeon]
MTTDVKDNSRAQLNTTYSGEIGFKFSESAKPMTPEETVEFLNQPAEKIRHPVLQSTLYNPQLEERIL